MQSILFEDLIALVSPWTCVVGDRELIGAIVQLSHQRTCHDLPGQKTVCVVGDRELIGAIVQLSHQRTCHDLPGQKTVRLLAAQKKRKKQACSLMGLERDQDDVVESVPVSGVVFIFLTFCKFTVSI